MIPNSWRKGGLLLLFMPVWLVACTSISTQEKTTNLASKDYGLSKQRQSELLHLLKQDCGSCHGMTLKGGLGSALTQARMAALPADYLFHTIWEGRTDKAMPPWKHMLTKQEVHWLVQQLQNGKTE